MVVRGHGVGVSGWWRQRLALLAQRGTPTSTLHAAHPPPAHVQVCWRVACFFPGVTVAVLTTLNLFLWYTGSSGAIPLGFFFSIIFLWCAGGCAAVRACVSGCWVLVEVARVL